MTAGIPRSASARTSLRRLSWVCCTTPGIDTTGSDASMPSFTKSGATRSSTLRRCSATRRRSAGVRRSRRRRCSGNDTLRWYPQASRSVGEIGERQRYAGFRARPSTRPSMVCGSASASTRKPSSRAVSDVTGPIEITDGCGGGERADRVAEVLHRRRRRERDRVDLAGAHARRDRPASGSTGTVRYTASTSTS